MSGSDVTIASKKGDSTLVRPRFGPGMLLQHEDLEYLGAYPRELSRLLFRSFFGCGVVCGLVVKTTTDCGKVSVTVEPGLALGCSGEPIWVPKPQTFDIDEDCHRDLPTPLYVVLCPYSKCCAPRPSTCGSDDEEAPSVCTREREGFEIRVVREWPACACGCPEVQTGNPGDYRYVAPPEPRESDCFCADPTDLCHVDHYDGTCGCTCGDCSDCDCQCVLLARLDEIDEERHLWQPSHKVRRFIRPVLMRDPQVEIEARAVVHAAALVAKKEKEAEEEAAWRERERQWVLKQARTQKSKPAPKTAAAAKTVATAKTRAGSKAAAASKSTTSPKTTTTPRTAATPKPETPPK